MRLGALAICLALTIPAAADGCTELSFSEPLLGMASEEGPVPLQWGSWMDASLEGGAMNVRLTNDIDPNHKDGFGNLQLVAYNYLLGGVDLRDATVTFSLEGEGFEPNGSNLFVWAQACDRAEHYARGFECGNWALSSEPLTHYLTTGGEHQVQVNLTNDEDLWSYGGNYSGQGVHATRYRYLPLERVLAEAVNLHFVLAHPDGATPASGVVRIKDVRICEAENDQLAPKIISATRAGYDVHLRVHPLGFTTTVDFIQNDSVQISQYVGRTRHPLDVYLNDTELLYCPETKLRISGGGERFTFYDLARPETFSEAARRIVSCNKPLVGLALGAVIAAVTLAAWRISLLRRRTV